MSKLNLNLDSSKGFSVGSQGGYSGTATDGNSEPSQSELDRTRFLCSRNTTPDEIFNACGRGMAGSQMVLAHLIIWETDCWIYGGFIRDYVIGDRGHDEMDLDIALPTTMTDIYAAFNKVCDILSDTSKHYANLGLKVKTVNHNKVHQY